MLENFSDIMLKCIALIILKLVIIINLMPYGTFSFNINNSNLSLFYLIDTRTHKQVAFSFLFRI